jgi:hypothetical protein
MRFIGAHELLAEVASKDAQEAKSGSKIRSHTLREHCKSRVLR